MDRLHYDYFNDDDDDDREPVIIKLDQSIGSKYLLLQFTNPLQLFLKYVPVLYWYPLDIIGSDHYIDPHVLRNVVKNPWHKYNTFDLIYSMTRDDKKKNTQQIMMPTLNGIDWYRDRDDDDRKDTQMMLTLNRIAWYTTVKENEKLDPRKVKLQALLRSFLDDAEFVLFVMVYGNVDSLKHISDRLKDDEEFMIAAVKHNGDEIQNASDRLKDNHRVVMEAVKQNGYSLYYVSDRLKDCEEIVVEAIKQNGDAIVCASPRLKHDEAIKSIANERGSTSVYHTEYVKRRKIDSQDDDQVPLHEIYQVQFATAELKNSEEYMLEKVKQSVLFLQFASDRLKDNEEFVMKACQLKTKALLYASDRLRNNVNFINRLFECCKTFNVLEGVGEKCRNIQFILNFLDNYRSQFFELINELR